MERRCYEENLHRNAAELRDRVRPGDLVILHDPQTAGLASAMRAIGAVVVWRCHVGHEHPTPLVQRAWAFLAPYLCDTDANVFTRKTFIPDVCDHGRSVIIAPSIDPLSAKNRPMPPSFVRSILTFAGIIEARNNGHPPHYYRGDGSISRVERAADMIRLGRAPDAERPLVVQVSRWDHLKDPLGVMEGFARHLAHVEASLVLAGPNVTAVADDPEGGQVLDEVQAAWRSLPHEVRKHVHIACLPMDHREENAAIVNALQRHASVIVQKSIQEGFGLTVTEAMWKGRAVVASAVGGIQDQIEDGVHGLLLHDPADLESFGAACGRLLADRELARRLGRNAKRRVKSHFLFTRHLFQYGELFARLLR